MSEKSKQAGGGKGHSIISIQLMYWKLFTPIFLGQKKNVITYACPCAVSTSFHGVLACHMQIFPVSFSSKVIISMIS